MQGTVGVWPKPRGETEVRKRQRAVLHRGDRASRGDGQGNEVRSGVVNLIAVAHPDDVFSGHVVEEGAPVLQHVAFGPANSPRTVDRSTLPPMTSAASCMP